MALQGSEEKVSLDHVQEHMLGALVRLGDKDPSKRRDYPTIHDEVRKHTKGDVTLEMADLRKARPILESNGLIADGGIGFTVTNHGRKTFSELSAKPGNEKVHEPVRH